MRVRWEDLPESARRAVEAVCGSVVVSRSSSQGFGLGVASRLETESASFFLKACPLDSGRALSLYTRERRVNGLLPPGVSAPRMLWSEDVGGWRLLLFDFAGGHEADLRPGSPDVPPVMEAIAELAISLTPCPDKTLPSVTENIRFLVARAESLLADPPPGLPDLELYAKALDGLDPDDATGDTLLHADLKADNILVTNGRAVVIDWALACQGAAWVEVALLVPWLIKYGRTPEQAEHLAAEAPAWGEAPDRTLTGLAAAWTLFREYMAHHGPVSLREQRARSAAVGRTWVRHRTS